MRNFTKASIFAATASVAILVGLNPASAQLCAGVEGRVNAQTSVLEGAVVTTITATEAAMIAEELRQRALLLSAIKVLTQQSSVSNDQATNTTKQSSEAFASAHTTQRKNQMIADASHRYGSVGYDPCGSNTKQKSLYQAIQAAPAQGKTIATDVYSKPGQYADARDWTALMKSSAKIDAGSVFAGDIQGTKGFINAVIGPPDARNPTIQGTALGDQAALLKGNRDAYKSLTASAVGAIAADYASGGPIEKMRALSKHWVGDDGGEKWAASVAGDHQRGILQDTIRIEAANLALLAFQIKNGVRNEASAAALLLAVVNRTAASQNAVSINPRVQKASMQP